MIVEIQDTSSNGTFVNNQKLKGERTQLNNGDVIHLIPKKYFNEAEAIGFQIYFE